jgi:hypothetical protein
MLGLEVIIVDRIAFSGVKEFEEIYARILAMMGVCGFSTGWQITSPLLGRVPIFPVNI